MRNFFDEQGRTKFCNEAYSEYVEEVNLRRTQFIGKRAISDIISFVSFRCPNRICKKSITFDRLNSLNIVRHERTLI